MAEAAPKEKWKMARYRPTMDFAKAKMVIGLPSGAKAEDLDHEDIHERFVKKLSQASLPNSKVDPRLLHEAYQLLVKTNEKKAPRK